MDVIFFSLAAKISPPKVAGRKRTHDEGTASMSLGRKSHFQAILSPTKWLGNKASSLSSQKIQENTS